MDIELGGAITLKGFGELSGGELIVVKKLVGRYARKLSESSKDYEGLTVTMKPVHKTPKGQKFEIHASMIASGKKITSEVTDVNIFVALDSALQKVEKQS
ncbi:hypothetical protein ACFL1B_02930 [Nanoarchaeota archaeon]